MLKKITIGTLMIAVFAGLAGCDGGIYMGSNAMGVRSGEFVYSAGYVTAVYNAPLKQVWQTTEAILKEMKATDIKQDMKIAQGTIDGLISEEKITIRVEYREREMTAVSILVGMGGSKIAAQLIHEKITQKLKASQA
ncbi:MAG: DUF3568 family protein [Syntrophales bacterium]|nr:DUF3568 family protein [Syntrophales bacterium]